MYALISKKQAELQQANTITTGMKTDANVAELLNSVEKAQKQIAPLTLAAGSSTKKAPVGESHRTSLTMYQEGKDVATIAQERGLAQSTIEGHLVGFILTGDIAINDMLSQEKIAKITTTIHQFENVSSNIIKQNLPADYTFTDIRAVMNHLKRQETEYQ